MTNPITSNTLLTDSILVLIGFISSFDVNVGYGYGVAYYIGVSLSILHPHFSTFYVHFLVPLKTVFFYDLLSLMWLALLGGVIIFFQSQPAPRTPAPQPAEGDSPDVPDDDDGWPAWLRRLLRILAIIGVSVAVIGLVIWFWVNFGTPSVPVPPASPVPVDIPPVLPVPVDIPIPPVLPLRLDQPAVPVPPTEGLIPKSEIIQTVSEIGKEVCVTVHDFDTFLAGVRAISGTQDEILAAVATLAATLVATLGVDGVHAALNFLDEVLRHETSFTTREVLFFLIRELGDLLHIGHLEWRSLHYYAENTVRSFFTQYHALDQPTRDLLLFRLHDSLDRIFAGLAVSGTSPVQAVDELVDAFRILSSSINRVLEGSSFLPFARSWHLLNTAHPVDILVGTLDHLRHNLLCWRRIGMDEVPFFIDVLIVFPEILRLEMLRLEPTLTANTPPLTVATLRLLVDQLHFFLIVGVDALPATLPPEMLTSLSTSTAFIDFILQSPEWARMLSCPTSPEVHAVLNETAESLNLLKLTCRHICANAHSSFQMPHP